MSARNFDVLVIGGGIAGASIAALLAESRTVAVLEREAQPTYHSTGRSAALFSEIYGGDTVRALSRGSREFFYTPPSDFAEAPLVKRRGSLYVATKAQQIKLEAFAALPDIGPATRRLSANEAISLCPILRPDLIAAAVLEPSAADIDVDVLHQGYLRKLRGHGGLLFTDHPVQSLKHEADQWIVTAGGERFTAPTVVNAAGAWADDVGRLAGASVIGLQPKRRTALLVSPPAGVAIDAWPMVIDIEEQFYFKPDAGLLMLSPADETPVEACDVQPEEWDVAVAVDRVQSVTTLEVRSVKHRWAGLRSFVADRAPVAGYDVKAPGFFWLAGHGGYGIQTAPALSTAAAALVLGEPIPDHLMALGVDAARLSPARLEKVNC
jgi:D-arginine dehydrogenase